MEIILSLDYDARRHSTIDFIDKYFKKMATQMMSFATVSSMISGKSIADSIEAIITTKWKYTKMVGSMVASQVHHIELVDDAWVHVYLLENAKRDKLIVYMSGQHNNVLTVDLGFVGDKATFDRYLTELTVSEIEAYSQVIHLVEGD